MRDRPFSYRALFAVVYTTSVSSVYFALGVVARHANGLTPAVFLVAGLFFGLTAMTYAEGASLHPERGGSAVFARYAFNELVSFIAGWAIFLDYTILIAVTALTVPAYLAAFAAPIGRGTLEIAVAFAVIALVAVDNLTGVSVRRLRPRLLITAGDLILQALIIVLGFALVFDPHALSASIHLGTAPSWSDLAFALPIAVIAFTGLEAAASIAGEVSATRETGQAAGRPGLGGDRPDLRRDLAGRRRRAPGPRRRDRARHDAHQGAGARAWSRRSIRSGWPTCSSTRSRSEARSACSPRPGRRCSASPASATRSRPTGRSRARSGGSTAAGARRT